MAVRVDDRVSTKDDMALQGGYGGAVDLYDLAALLWRQRLVLAIFALMGLAIGLTCALLLPPFFRAETTVQIRAERDGGSTLRSLSGQLGPLSALAGALVRQDADERGVAIATLQSRAIIEGYIERNNLLPLLFDRSWDADNQRWKRSDPRFVPTAQDGFKRFRGKIFSVTDDKKTGLVIVAVEWKDPVLAARWLNDLIAESNALLKSRTIRESEANLRYLEEQAKTTQIVELRLTLYKLMEAEYNKLMIARNAEDYAFRTIDPAVVPKKKIRPQRALIAGLSCVAGLATGVAFALVRAALQKRHLARALGEVP